MLSPADHLAAGFLDQHLDRFADPGLRALRDKRIDDVTEMIPPLCYLPRRQLPVEAGGLGSVLVGVAENPDRVQPRCYEELLEDLEISLGFAGKAADDVAPNPRPAVPSAGWRRADVRKRSGSPNRRIRRSTGSDAC